MSKLTRDRWRTAATVLAFVVAPVPGFLAGFALSFVVLPTEPSMAGLIRLPMGIAGAVILTTVAVRLARWAWR